MNRINEVSLSERYERCEKYYGVCKKECLDEESLSIECTDEPDFKCCVKKPPGELSAVSTRKH